MLDGCRESTERREGRRVDRQREGWHSAFHTLLVLIQLIAMAVLLSLLFLGPPDGGHHLTLRLPLDLLIDFLFFYFFITFSLSPVVSVYELNMVIISFRW